MRIIITALLINFLIIPSTISGSFESSETNKYIGSGFGQVFGPLVVAGAVKAMDNFIAKHKKPHADQYFLAKSRFYQMLKETNVVKRLTDKGARNTFIGYFNWAGWTRLPFIGFARAFDPAGLTAWTLTQLFTQENKFVPKAIQKAFGLQKGIIESIIPDKLPTFDFNLKENAKISSFVQNGKIRIQESIYSNEKGFIVGKPIYSSDGLSAEIILDRHKLKLFPEESDRVKISLSPTATSKGRNVSKIDFSIKSGSHLWKGSDSSSKAAPMIWDIGVNKLGRDPAYNKLRPLTTFIFESGGRGYTVPIHIMIDKIVRIGVGTAAAWPMMEVGRQLWSSGMLNFGVHFLTSYDVLFAFMFGGITGKAVGSRVVDIAVLTGAKLDNALMKKFPALKKRFPVRKNYGQLRSCTDFMTYMMKPPLRGRTDLTMDVVRSVLWNRYGAVYNYGTLALSAYGCGRFASGLTSQYRNAKSYVLDIFAPLEKDDPTAPYDLSGFPPEGAGDHSINPSEVIDSEDDGPSILKIFEGIAKVVTPSFSMSAQSTIANAEKAFNEENGIEENQLSLDQETMGQLYDMQADSVTSTMAKYEKNPEAFHDLLWLTYLMTQPIKEIQQDYLAKVDIAIATNEPIVELKKVLYEFLEDFNQGQHKRSVYKAFEQEFKNSGGIDMTSFMAEKVASFIGLSDVLIFATQYSKVAQEAPNVVGAE